MMNNELRALETEKDYQKEIDSLEQKREKCIDTVEKLRVDWMKLEDEYDKKVEQIKKEQNSLRAKAADYVSQIRKLKAEAKQKGFNIRSEETNTEQRGTFREYQQEYNSYKKTYLDAKKEYDKLEKEIKKMKDEQSKLKVIMDMAEEDMEDTLLVAEKKGYDLKRSEEVDFEARKKEVVGDLTGLNERKQEALNELEERKQGKLNSYEACKKSYESNKKYLEKYKEEIEMFNEQIDIRKDKIKKLEAYMEEADSVAKSKFGKSVK